MIRRLFEFLLLSDALAKHT